MVGWWGGGVVGWWGGGVVRWWGGGVVGWWGGGVVGWYHTIVTNQSLAHKEEQVGVVDLHELGELSHELVVVLHAPCGVHQHYVKSVGRTLINRGLGLAVGVAAEYEARASGINRAERGTQVGSGKKW